MGMIVWHMVPGDDSTAGALDLATCVYNNDMTTFKTGGSSGGITCAYDTSGFLAWGNSENTDITYGLDISPTPFILPGGTPVLTPNLNGNDIYSLGEKGWRFSYDGTKLYTGALAQVFTLPTPWDVTTRVIASVNPSLDSGRTSTISRDGLSVYRISPNNTVTKWNLSVAWDLTTAVVETLNTGVFPADIYGIVVSNDETRIYVSIVGLEIHEYIMSTPGDLTSIPESFGVMVPNYILDVTFIGHQPGGVYVSYDMQHLLIGYSAVLNNRLVSFTGDAV